jgi:hypothetical protein
MTCETQGPFYLIWVINRRNGIQYGMKPRKVWPKRIKK